MAKAIKSEASGERRAIGLFGEVSSAGSSQVERYEPEGVIPEGERTLGESSWAPDRSGGNGSRALISTTPESTGEWGRESKGRTGRPTVRGNAEAIGRER